MVNHLWISPQVLKDSFFNLMNYTLAPTIQIQNEQFSLLWTLFSLKIKKDIHKF